MYFAADVEVDARASLVHPPAPLRSSVSLGGVCVCLEGVSDEEVGSEVGEGVTVGGVSETGGAGSVAAPFTSPEKLLSLPELL